MSTLVLQFLWPKKNKETDFKQIPIAEYKTLFETSLDPRNRWVRLANAIHWEKLAEINTRDFRKEFGRSTAKTQNIGGEFNYQASS